MALLVAVVVGIHVTNAAESRSGKPGPRSPLAPAAALKQFVLHPKLRIELVASEPQVVDPVAIAFDEDGRLWVVEMRDYPNGPKRQSRTLRVRSGVTDPGSVGMSRIRLLEDRDGDGHYETAHTFAEKLLFVTGLQPWRGGVIVTLAGEVAYFKDTDGDGKADLRETWFTGFAEKNSQLRANHPTFALDNHIYVANGLRGGSVIARRKNWAKNAKPVSISGMDFRFDPIRGKYEAVSGPGQFGLTFDDFGNRFVCSNRNPCRHVVLEDRYLKRNPYLAVRSVLHDVSPAGAESRVFPISRFWTTSNLHAGQFTAACGVTIYRGNLLPAEFQGNSFTCEPTGNLVHRDILKPLGATFTSRPGRKGIEFLATKDEWFRPVNLANGPDGALYVVDMYRAVIEHPQWVPDELKHRPDLRFGDTRGRIYRIVAKPEPGSAKPDRGHRPRLSKLSRASTADLVKLLENPNAWQRMTAARLIYERQDKTAVKPLEAIVRDPKKSEIARVHALWALDGICSTSIPLLSSLLEDGWKAPHICEHALRLFEPFLKRPSSLPREAKNREEIRRSFRLMLSKPRVKFQTALTLGEFPAVERRKKWVYFILATTVVLSGTDDWTRHAAASSVVLRPVEFLKSILDNAAILKIWNRSETQESVELAAEMVGNAGKELPQALKLLASGGVSLSELRVRMAGIRRLERGARRNGKSLEALLKDSPAAVNKRVYRMFDVASGMARFPKGPNTFRLEGIEFLALFDYAISGKPLKLLAHDSTNSVLQVVAIRSLARSSHREVAAALLRDFQTRSPEVKRAILDAMLASASRTKRLLDEIAAKRISVRELDPARVRRLTRHRNAAIRNRARKLLAAAIPADRKKVLAAYQRALSLKADAFRGQVVFRKNCTACHRIGKLGVNVAPDISDSRTKTPAQLLVSILDPNRAIDNNYISYTAITVNGKVHTGVIATETASSITLRQQENKTVTLLRKDIETLKSNGISLIPVGLEKNIPVQQMADLIAFIKNWRYLDGRVPIRTK